MKRPDSIRTAHISTGDKFVLKGEWLDDVLYGVFECLKPFELELDWRSVSERQDNPDANCTNYIEYLTNEGFIKDLRMMEYRIGVS